MFEASSRLIPTLLHNLRRIRPFLYSSTLIFHSISSQKSPQFPLKSQFPRGERKINSANIHSFCPFFRLIWKSSHQPKVPFLGKALHYSSIQSGFCQTILSGHVSQFYWKNKKYFPWKFLRADDHTGCGVLCGVIAFPLLIHKEKVAATSHQLLNSSTLPSEGGDGGYLRKTEESSLE